MRKRYEYHVSGSRLSGIACTLCASSAKALMISDDTNSPNSSSSAMSSATSRSVVKSEIRRVHKTTDVGSGSPEATPRRNGFGLANSGASTKAVSGAVVVVGADVLVDEVDGVDSAGSSADDSEAFEELLEHAAATPANPVARKCRRLRATARFYQLCVHLVWQGQKSVPLGR